MNIAEAHLKVLEHFSRPGAELAKGAFNPLAPQDQNNRCYYRSNGRGDDPRRCGVGVLIPDEMYDFHWEHTSCTAFGSPPIALLINDNPEVAELFKDLPVAYLSDLQGAHDGATSPEDLLVLLEELQEKYGIELVPDHLPVEESLQEDRELVTV